MKILLIEDDPLLNETLAHYLHRSGYDVTSVRTIMESEEITFENDYDLYLVDVNLPDGTGTQLLEDLRFAEDETPTIFITALTDIETIGKCFDLGAIDYIKKPFDPEELLVRIRAKFADRSLHYGDIIYDTKHKILKKRGKTIDLATVPLRIFEKLLVHCGEIVTKEALYECLEHGSDTALRVAISKIKQTLGIEITNIRGRGYLLEEL